MAFNVLIPWHEAPARLRRAQRAPQSMPVDVTTSIVIQRPLSEVASFSGDPERAPDWYENIKSVEWKSCPPLQVGSQVAFVAEFLGRKLSYTYEIVRLDVGEELVMHTHEGPFAMETTYRWERHEPYSTRMTLRNRGEPTGFGKFTAPLMAIAMKRANQKDLRNLRDLLESQNQNGPLSSRR